MCSLVISLDATNSTDIERSEKLHTTECERLYSKRKSHYLFQVDHIQLQSSVSSVTSWKYTVQAVPSKKKKEGEGKERGGKEEKKKKKRGRERRIENKESDTRSVPPPPDAFPSVKLGNNMTPTRGRLGKNTTPTSRSPTKLNQNLQVDPQ